MSYKSPPTAHGQYFDTTTQTIASATTAQIITFNTTDVQTGMTKGTGTGSVANSRFTLPSTGIYQFNLSVVVNVASGGAKSMSVWFRSAVSGGTPADIANSATTIDVSTVSQVLSVPFFYNCTAINDIVEIWMSGTATACEILAVAAGVSPTRPASPSIIMTINKISK
tara:strand:- start:283 stop:786 length:504 start_codon:yes stop_codon:yes gene_type:complete